TNALPFYWRGFDLRLNYTYRIEDLSDLDRVWAECSDKCRNSIRKARATLEIRDDLTADDFYDVAAKSWTRQGLTMPLRRDIVVRLVDACRLRGAGEVFHCSDALGRVHSAVFMVWDDRTAYNLLAGSDPG